MMDLDDVAGELFGRTYAALDSEERRQVRQLQRDIAMAEDN
jgi:hypothetical protein